jgi:hypothetical protein
MRGIQIEEIRLLEIHFSPRNRFERIGLLMSVEPFGGNGLGAL